MYPAEHRRIFKSGVERLGKEGGGRGRGRVEEELSFSRSRLAHISNNCARPANSREYDPHSRYGVLNALPREILIQPRSRSREPTTERREREGGDGVRVREKERKRAVVLSLSLMKSIMFFLPLMHFRRLRSASEEENGGL